MRPLDDTEVDEIVSLSADPDRQLDVLVCLCETLALTVDVRADRLDLSWRDDALDYCRRKLGPMLN